MSKICFVTTLKILQLLEDFVPRPRNGAPPQTPVVLPPSQTSFRHLWFVVVQFITAGLLLYANKHAAY